MKKSKIMIACSAFVLAIAGAFASNANSQRALVTFYTKVNGSCQITTDCAPNNPGQPCTYYTNGGTSTNCQISHPGKRLL
jgi:hypothetical protein